jgi:hypothetical protein
VSRPEDAQTPDDAQPSSDAPEVAPFEPVSTRRALRGIGRELFSPKERPGARGSLSSKAVKEIVFGLDKRERTFGIVLTVLNLYVIFVRANQLHTSSKATLRSESATFLALGLALCAFMILAIGIKRRALLGFSSVFLGLVFLEYGAPSEFFLTGAFGIWLILRAQKAQKLQRSTSPRVAASARPAKAAKARSAKAAASAAAQPKTPGASKRYTPPKRSRTSGRR